MMKIFIITFVGLFVAFSDLCFASAFKEPSQEEVTKAIETFKFLGQWISPKIIKEFLPWESDDVVPLIHSIDVSAATASSY